jgi:hypothetical protein
MRTLPEELKASLIHRASQYIMKANDFIAEVPDKVTGIVTQVGYQPKGATKEDPLGQERGLVEALARQIKEQKDKEEQDRTKKEIEVYAGFNEIGDNIQNEPDVEDCPDLSDIFDKEPQKRRFGRGL